jgi:hypothetical protein
MSNGKYICIKYIINNKEVDIPPNKGGSGIIWWVGVYILAHQ